MAYSPYQIAGSQASLYDLMKKGELSEQKQKTATKLQKRSMEEEFEKELELAQAKARNDAKKNKGLFKGVNLLASIFGGPLGIGLTKGITAKMQGDQQRKALEELLSGVDSDRWKKTFLRDQAKSYKEEAEDLQMSSGDVLRGAFGAGLTGFMGSKLMGGDEGSMFKQWRTGRQAASHGQDILDIEKKAAETYGKSMESDVLLPEGITSKQKWIQSNLKKRGVSDFAVKNYKDVAKSFENIAGSSTPGFSNLWKNLVEGKGLTGGMEELQSAMMFPSILQQFLGEDF